MAEILRVPITTPDSRNQPDRAKLSSGGFDTAFVELPYYYILGGYMYSKANLAPVTNGFCGLMTDFKMNTKDEWIAHKAVENGGIVHANMLSYWGGPYMGFRMSMSLGGASGVLMTSSRNPCMWNQGGGMGTIIRKPRPTSSIRDSEDPNIVYYVMVGPDYGFVATVSKFDMTTKQTVWRQQFLSSTTTSVPNNTDVSLSNDVLSMVSKDLDYLYQDKHSIYILGCGPKTSNNGYDPTSVYVFAINKEDGTLSESNRFNLFTLGVFDTLTENPSYISYRFLGFVSQTVFLLDVQQGVLSTRATVTLNPARNSRVGRVLLSYDVSDDSIKVLWQAPLVNAPVPTAGNYSMIHDCYGPLVLDSLNNSVFIPYSSGITGNVNIENVYQLHLSEDKDRVLSCTKLPYYDGQGKRRLLLPLYDEAAVNTIGGYDHAWTHSYNPDIFYWGSKDNNMNGEDAETGPWPGYTPTGNTTWCELGAYEDAGFVEYMPQSADNNYTIHRPARVSYEYMNTERHEPILRILGCIPVTGTRKTILPCGEDIIGAGYESCHCSSTEGVSAAFFYTDPSGVAHPWGVIVEHSSEWVSQIPYDYGSAYAKGAMGNCFGITSAPQGFPYMYLDTSDAGCRDNRPYIPSARFGAFGYVAEFANGNPSYTLRRSSPDLVDCCIYLNNKPMPIHAVSYSLNPNPFYISFAPTSWYVEALDVETNSWIEVDRQTDVALGFPPNMNVDYARLSITSNCNLGITELRQYRTYFTLEDMETKCPKGAHAFRITFTDSADGKKVSISQFMIQEKPWPWQPAMAAEYICARLNNVTPKISDDTQIAVSCNPNVGAALNIITATARSNEGNIPSLAQAINGWDSTRMGHIPINMSVIGPRTAVFMHGPLHSNYGYLHSPYYGEGVFIYSGGNSYLPVGTYLKYEFAEPLEIQGIQLTVMGNRDVIYGQPVSSKTGATLRYPSASYGCGNSDDMVIQGSNDNTTWDDLAHIDDADLMPGLPNTYVANIPVWSKTFLFELDNPVSYKYYRVYWNKASMTIAAGFYAGRAWVVNSFSFFKKRNPNYASKVLPTQSVVGTYINYSTRRNKGNNSPYYETYGSWYDWNKYRLSNFWNPWVTWVSTEDYSVPEGFTFPGFDSYRTLNLGYSGRGLIYMNHNNQDPENEGINHGCICKANTIALTGAADENSESVSVIASWQGWHARKQKPEGANGHEKYYGDFVNATDIDSDLISFKDALYASRIKIDAYAFVRSSYWKYDKGVPTKWKVYGSNDGRTWAVIDEREKTDWSRVDTYVEFEVGNPDWYTYYKVEFIESSDGGVSLLSIDTFIEGIDENCPYVYTTGHYYSKAWSDTDGLSTRGKADNITVTTTKGLLAKNQGVDARNYTSDYQSLVQNQYGASLVSWSGAGKQTTSAVHYYDKWGYEYPFRTHSYTYQDGKVTLLIDMCKPVPAGGFKFKLHPSMDEVEIPKHILIRGSNDKENWTELLDADEIDWGNDYYEPLKKIFDFEDIGMYRYFEVTFFASEEALAATYNEHWLYRMEIRNGVYGRCATTIFKVKPDTGIYPVGGDNYMNSANNAVANFWVSNDTCATITEKDIQIQKMNPITQEMALINRITPENDKATFLGAIMDSGKNIWYWTSKGTTRTLPGSRWAMQEGETDVPGLYSALNVYSSFSNETVHVEFESSNMLYEGEPLEFDAYVWVDVNHPEGTKLVSSNVSLTLSGGSAVFKGGTNTTTITTSATEKTKVTVVASGPDRVNITATLVK